MPIKFLNDVAVDSSVLYVDTINNRVGVGVASPAVKLHAGSTSTSGVTTEEFRLQSGTSSGNGGTAIANLVTGNFGISGIYFGNNTTYSSQPVYLQYQRSSNVTTLQFDNIFKIDQNASSIFYINPSGNVGIGTTSPSQKLHVSGNARVTGAYYDSNNSAGTSGQVLSSTATGTDWVSLSEIQGVDGTGTANTVAMWSDSDTITDAPITVSGNNSTFAGDVLVEDNLYLTDAGTVRGKIQLNASDRDDLDIKAVSLGSNMKFFTVDTERMRIDSSGNVGIGTTSPAAQLHIEGDGSIIRLQNNSSDANGTFIDFRDSTGTRTGYVGTTGTSDDMFLFTQGAKPIRFYTNASERMHINSSGNVGIGTASPSNGKLEIQSSTNQISVNTGTTGDGRLHIGHFSNGTFIGTYGDDGGAADLIRFGTHSGDERMRITSTGNVGIGTTSPLTKLQVGDGTNDDAVRSYFNDGSYTEMRGYGLQFSRNASYIRPTTDNTKVLYLGSNVAQWNTLSIDASTTTFNTNGSENMRITSTGNVGIGTTSPLSQLTVQSSNATAYDATIDDGQDSDGATIMAFNTDNTTTDSFAQILFRNRSSNVGVSRIVSLSTAAASTALAFVTENSNTKAEKMRIASDGAIKFNTYGAGTLVTDSSGNITVSSGGGAGGPYLPLAGGTMSGNLEISKSSAKLILTDSSAGQASVDIRNSSLYARWILDIDDLFRVYNQTSGFDAFAIKSSGNVGIGTASPGEKLEVDGYAKVTALGINSSPDAYLSSLNARLAVGGNIVINTNLPQLYLRANSTSNTSDIRYQNSLKLTNGSGSTHLTVTSGGDVGIGTTSPGAKLDVEAGGTGDAQGDSTTAAIFRAGRQNVWFQNQRTAAGTDWNNNTFKIIAQIDSTSHQSINFVNDASYNEHIDIYTGNQVFNTRFNANGSVGIGTTSPNNLGFLEKVLNISAGSSSSTTLQQAGIVISGSSDADDADDFGYLSFTNYQSAITNDRVAEIRALKNGTNVDTGEFAFYTSSGSGPAERMRITSSGDVGIGTTSPSNKLDVNGNIEASRIILPTTGTAGGGTVTTPAGKLDIRSDSTWSNSAIIARTTTNQNPVLAFYRPSGGSATSYPWWLEANGSTFQIKTGSAANIGSETVSTKVTINSSGNVGIGTTSPGAKLHVSGSQDFVLIESTANSDATYRSKTTLGYYGSGTGIGSASNCWNVYDFNAGSERMRITSTGNVGIGTTSPAAKLEVEGGDHLFQLSTAATAGSPYLSFNQAGTRRSFIQHADSGDTLKLASEYGGIDFYTGTSGSETEKMTIQSNGNVGIGITAPVVKLHIGTSSGSGSTTEEFRIQTGTGAGYGGNAVVNLNTGAFGKSGIYFGNNGSLSYANQDSFLEYDDFSGETKLNFGNTLTINKGTSSAIYVDSFGRVGLGTTSPQYQLQLSTNSAAKPTSSAWTVVSDERVKTNIRPYETGLQELLQIEPKLFDYNGKAGFDATTKNNIGVIAQDIKDIMPETVKKYNAKLNEEDEEDTELYNFDSHALTFALINSVKELNAKIENLEAEIQKLKNK